MKKLRITVQGKAYDVLVEVLDDAPPAPASVANLTAKPEAARVVETVAPAAPRPTETFVAGPRDIVSPLSGKLVALEVKNGDQVNAGDRVATVEAMKMNTLVFAPSSGKIAETTAKIGDSVDEGMRLFRLE